MKLSWTAILQGLASALPIAPAALAQPGDWMVRCRLTLAEDGKPESGKYFFATRGKAADAASRAQLDYNTSVSARAAAYPTAAKDLLNPYSNISISLGWFAPGDGSTAPSVGAVSMRAIGKGFAAIPGGPISMKLVVDGAVFGPYEPNPVSSGMYAVWLDTAETDGDGKPPRLSPADFGRLATAVATMKSADVVLIRDGVDLVRATVPAPQLAAWRDGLRPWAAKHSPGAAMSCPGGEVAG